MSWCFPLEHIFLEFIVNQTIMTLTYPSVFREGEGNADNLTVNLIIFRKHLQRLRGNMYQLSKWAVKRHCQITAFIYIRSMLHQFITL